MTTLDAIIAATRATRARRNSYTRTLLDKGVAHCAKKFGEEAVEATIAAVAQDDAALRAEAADVLYHLLVMLRARDVPLAEVLARTGAADTQQRPRGKGVALAMIPGAPQLRHQLGAFHG